jgi:hypothetical protein
VLAAIDAQLEVTAPGWNTLSRDKITELVDWMVIELNPDAVRIAHQRDLDRHIEIGPGQYGMAESWGEVLSPDAGPHRTPNSTNRPHRIRTHPQPRPLHRRPPPF